MAGIVAHLACGRVDAANRFWTGDGTWNLTNTNWGTATGGPYTSTWSNSAPDAAIFEDTAGTVTLAMTATTSGMTFNTTGYTVTGNAIAMRGGSLTIASGVTATIASKFTGPGVVTKSGAGVLRLTSTLNDFGGEIRLSNGTLEMALIPSSNVIAFYGGTLRYIGGTNRTSSRPLQINSTVARLESSGAGTINFSSSAIVTGAGAVTLRLGGTNTGDNFWRGRLNNISGPAAMNKADAGTWIVTGDSGYTGGTTISGGTLGFGSTTALGTGTVTFSANATLRATVSGTLANTMSTGASSAVTATVDTQANEVTLSGTIDGAGNLTKTGAGTVTLTADNTYTGATTVSAGALAIGDGGTTGSVVGDIVNDSAVTVNRSNAVTYVGAISGTGTLTKQGAGNLVLAGTSSYTGDTTISAGRLSVDGAVGDSPVMVLAAAELGGSGSIGGPVSVASGGTLAPGNSIESLATGTATFAGGATFAYEVDSTNPLSLGAAADLLVVNGDLNLDPGNGTILTVTDLAGSPKLFVANTTIFALINYAGDWNGGLFTYDGNVLADGGTFMVGSQQWMIDYDLTSSAGLDNFTGDYLPSSKFVAMMAVPEPSTYAMALAGLTCGGFSMRRRRKRA